MNESRHAQYTTTDGTTVAQKDVDLLAAVTTPARVYHHAFTGTGAINLACLAAIPGSLVDEYRSLFDKHMFFFLKTGLFLMNIGLFFE
jgi:2-methylaconitate cis-trans-isomerase PrpF